MDLDRKIPDLTAGSLALEAGSDRKLYGDAPSGFQELDCCASHLIRVELKSPLHSSVSFATVNILAKPSKIDCFTPNTCMTNIEFAGFEGMVSQCQTVNHA